MGVESTIGVLSSGGGSGMISGCSSESGSLGCQGNEWRVVGSQDKSANEASLGGKGTLGWVFVCTWILFQIGGFVTG